MNNENVGSIVYDARIDTRYLKSDAERAEKTIGGVGDASENTQKRSNSSFKGIAKVGLGAVIAASVAVGAAIIGNIGGAIKRVDTLNNSTRTFQNMGFSVDQITKSTDALKSSILGLPTPLDAAISGVQLIASSIGDIGKAQKIFSALNNGILGFGGNTEQVSGAIQQLSQDLAGGTLTAETWNSLLDRGLGPTLNAIAKQMGITSKDLKAGLSDGTISIGTFTDKLIELNEKGGGGLQSLQKIAKDSTSGIQTGFENMNTAITRGIASIIEKIGAPEISSTIASIGTVFETVLKGIADGVVIAKYAVDTFAQALKPVFDYIGGNQQVMEVLRLSLVAIAAIVGVLIIAIGVALVAAVAIVVAAIQVAIFVVEKIIEVIMAVGNAIADTVMWFGKLGNFAVKAVSDIQRAFNSLPRFFSSLWNNIISLFGSVGAAIGGAIGGAFRGVIHGIIASAVNIINGFINSINNIIGVVNNIPGVDIGRIGTLGVPQLAQGGIVSSPTLAMIGEGRESEAVIPLSKLDEMVNESNKSPESSINIELNMSGIMTRSRSDTRAVAQDLIESVNEQLRARRLPEIGGGNLRKGAL